MSFQTSALILSWVAILLLALVVSGLVRQVYALSTGRRGEPVGLGPGAAAPDFHRLAPERPGGLVLLFLDRDCRTCSELLDEIAERGSRDGLTLRALYRAAVPAELPADMALDVRGQQAELFDRYDAIATPFAVVVDPAGRVARSEPVGSRAALRALLAQAQGLPVGDPPPTTEQPTSPGGMP